MYFQCDFCIAVCVGFLERFYQTLKDDDVKFNSDSIEKALLKFCKDTKGKENRFVSLCVSVNLAFSLSCIISVCLFLLCVCVQCYYIGATSDAATKIINEVSKPMSHHVPTDKICEKLKKKDSQICELKYGKLHRNVHWSAI